MPRNSEASYFQQCFDLPNRGLESYFGIVRSGREDEYRTPFYKGKSLQQILSQWDKELVSVKDEWPSLYEFESDLREKVGPMSIMQPLSERMHDIEAYYEDVLLPHSTIADSAIKATIAEWRNARGIQMRSQKVTLDAMKKSTNSGSPYFTKRRTVVERTTPCKVSIKGDLVEQQLPSGEFGACAILGWRGQEGGPSDEDVKQRVVWMFPFAVNIEELQVYQPLIAAAQRSVIIPAWVGMDAVDVGVTRLFDTKSDQDPIICTDFSKFDQHFNQSCQDAALQCLKGLFNGGRDFEDWLVRVFPIKYMIPLAYDMGKIKFGNHGMGSGSGGTNADETLTHRCLQYEAAMAVGAKLNPYSQCLGDDGILSYPGCTVDNVVQSYSRHGLEMNPDKQYVSTEDCTYLRRWHHAKYRVNDVCVGVYSTFRALGRLCEMERFPRGWTETQVALRQLSIIENVKWHPLRERFAHYCMKGDKYRLGIDIPGFLDNIQSIVKESIDYIPDFNLGYTREQEDPNLTGIGSWWIVNYLKSQA